MESAHVLNELFSLSVVCFVLFCSMSDRHGQTSHSLDLHAMGLESLEVVDEMDKGEIAVQRRCEMNQHQQRTKDLACEAIVPIPPISNHARSSGVS